MISIRDASYQSTQASVNLDRDSIDEQLDWGQRLENGNIQNIHISILPGSHNLFSESMRCFIKDSQIMENNSHGLCTNDTEMMFHQKIGERNLFVFIEIRMSWIDLQISEIRELPENKNS